MSAISDESVSINVDDFKMAKDALSKAENIESSGGSKRVSFSNFIENQRQFATSKHKIGYQTEHIGARHAQILDERVADERIASEGNVEVELYETERNKFTG